jgi:hypothetical protein
LASGHLEIGDEILEGLAPGLGIWHAENGGGMSGDDDRGGEAGFAKELATILGQFEFAAEQRLRRRRAEANDDAGLHEGDFALQPGKAGVHFARAGPGMEAALAARGGFPLEVFDSIGEENFFTIEFDFGQGAIEHFPGRTDEWMALQVFLIAGLLANEQNAGRDRTLAENALGSVFVEIAAAALLERSAVRREAGGRLGGEERGGVHRLAHGSVLILELP